MVSLSLFSIERYTTFTDYSDEVRESNLVIRTLYKTEVFLKDMDRWERGYILSRDTGYLRVVNNVIDSLGPSLDRLSGMVGSNPDQLKNILFLKQSVESRISNTRKNIAYIDSTGTREASPYYFEGRKFMIASNNTIKAMHKVEDDLLAERFKKQQFYEQLTGNTLKSLLFIFCIVTLALFILLLKLLRSGMLYQEDLKAKVIDLKRSHSELQDIAYAISHDLQEPLRKIQVFSTMLLISKNNATRNDTDATLQRINNSASKMQSLIADLVSLTNLTQIDEQKKNIDLKKVTDKILFELNDQILEKNAKIEIEQLPGIYGYETQLHILFRALFDNALKFSIAGKQPHINVSYRILPGKELHDINPSLREQRFHCISVTDNGIGFDNKYITNIFKIFKRLHTEQSQYEGKGIGLAICQRIMANHEGYMIGEGVPGEGATFKLFFPLP